MGAQFQTVPLIIPRRRQLWTPAPRRQSRWRVPSGRRRPWLPPLRPELLAGNVQFHPDTGNVLFTAMGVAMDPACCCCVCPDGLPNCYTLTGHFQYLDTDDSTVLCEEDFEVTLIDSSDPQDCEYDNGSSVDFVCGLANDFVLSLQTDPCRWELAWQTAEDGIPTSSRIGIGNQLGAYANMAGFRYRITALVISACPEAPLGPEAPDFMSLDLL